MHYYILLLQDLQFNLHSITAALQYSEGSRFSMKSGVSWVWQSLAILMVMLHTWPLSKSTSAALTKGHIKIDDSTQ